MLSQKKSGFFFNSLEVFFFIGVEVQFWKDKHLRLIRMRNFDIVAYPDSIGSLVDTETYSLKISGGFSLSFGRSSLRFKKKIESFHIENI